MPLKIQLNETQIKITGEVNEKLQRIIQNPAFDRIKVDKKNFVNVLFGSMTDDELIDRYRRAIGLQRKE